MDELSKKLGQPLCVLRKIKRFLPLEKRKLYYNTMFKQVTLYGATIWANCFKENQKKFFDYKNALHVLSWMPVQGQINSVALLKQLNWLAFHS